MSSFLSISLWVALATVVPGLVTIAVSSYAVVISDADILCLLGNPSILNSDWIIAGIAITVMVLTQALGILLEELIVKFRLFPGCNKLKVPKEYKKKGEAKIDAYHQYEQLYILLAQLEEYEDSQGHLKRSAAQFFLTNNTLVSYITGIVVSLILWINSPKMPLMIYTIALILFLLISYWVAVIRFRVMAKSIWAAYTARQMKMTNQRNV